jgi:hypothetical protein
MAHFLGHPIFFKDNSQSYSSQRIYCFYRYSRSGNSFMRFRLTGIPAQV